MGAKSFKLAMCSADEYRRLYDGDRPVEAEQCRRSIEDLVGRFVRGKLVLPAPVAAAMGRPELAVQS